MASSEVTLAEMLKQANFTTESLVNGIWETIILPDPRTRDLTSH